MAYCPKCGVEVDDSIRKCPLCEFPVPDIHGSGDRIEADRDKYPEAANIYEAYRSKVKNQVYFVITILLLSSMLILTLVRFIYPVDSRIIAYIFYVVLALFMYTFFTYGYMNWLFNMTGIGVATLFLTYSIGKIGGQSWFMPYALPLISWVYVNALAFGYMYKHSAKRNRLGYLPRFVLLIGASLCLGIDGIVSSNMPSGLRFTWSLIVAISCFVIAYVLDVVLNHLPEHVKESLRRRFHV